MTTFRKTTQTKLQIMITIEMCVVSKKDCLAHTTRIKKRKPRWQRVAHAGGVLVRFGDRSVSHVLSCTTFRHEKTTARYHHRLTLDKRWRSGPRLLTRSINSSMFDPST